MKNAADSGDLAALLHLHTGLEGLVRGIVLDGRGEDILPATTDAQHAGHLRKMLASVMRMRLVFAFMFLLTTTGFAETQPQDNQTVKVGPWTIATTYKADKFENCTMSGSAENLGISFVRNQDGLLLLLDSSKWKLERGKAYSIRLVAGSQSVGTKALAETKGVTIALEDRPFNRKLRTANVLEVRGEGATIHVPLGGSAAALERLEVCFDKNQRESAETNPFVAPSRKP
jgi:hypothetical protein